MKLIIKISFSKKNSFQQYINYLKNSYLIEKYTPKWNVLQHKAFEKVVLNEAKSRVTIDVTFALHPKPANKVGIQT